MWTLVPIFAVASRPLRPSVYNQYYLLLPNLPSPNTNLIMSNMNKASQNYRKEFISLLAIQGLSPPKSHFLSRFFSSETSAGQTLEPVDHLTMLWAHGAILLSESLDFHLCQPGMHCVGKHLNLLTASSCSRPPLRNDTQDVRISNKSFLF